MIVNCPRCLHPAAAHQERPNKAWRLGCNLCRQSLCSLSRETILASVIYELTKERPTVAQPLDGEDR